MSWHAVNVRSNCENKVTDALLRKGIDAFFPSTSAEHKWSDRSRTIRQPLFSGYTFVRLKTDSERMMVLSTPGVAKNPRLRLNVDPVPEDVIESLRTATSANTEMGVSGLLRSGDPVRVVSGPLKGVKGVIARGGKDIVAINVEAIEQSVVLAIDYSCLERAKDTGGRASVA